jgi:prepilin-type processing-associated H-X9-DG protein
VGPDGNARISDSFFRDGTSNTIMVAEKYAHCQNPFVEGGSLWAYDNIDSSSPWFAPWHPGFEISFWSFIPGTTPVGPGSVFQLQPRDGTNCDPTRASTAHTGGMNVCLADGSVRNISSGVSGQTWFAACTPSGEEVLGSDW